MKHRRGKTTGAIGWIANTFGAGFVIITIALAYSPRVFAETTEVAHTAVAPRDKAVPQNVDDLASIQQRVEAAFAKALPATVAVRVGRAFGSGIIVSPNGYILTAGHVAAKPGEKVTIWMYQGRRLEGESLGVNDGMDSGLIKITTEGEWPYVSMADSEAPHVGTWCIALGHPGGYKPGRQPVLRLGRVIATGSRLIQTDCPLTAGDSGGPLLDLDGRVIGINSRIGNLTSANFHVPVSTFLGTWDRLVAGEAWDDRGLAFLGIDGTNHDHGAIVVRVHMDTPAESAQLLPDDVITAFDGQQINSFDALRNLIWQHKPGDQVTVGLMRGDQMLEKRIVLARHPDLIPD